jgi:signal transduction histidine kinase
MFVGVEAATFLILGASIGERRDAERAATDALATAESANRAKSEFLAVMSHELRTPLNAISGYVQLMEMEMHGPLTAAQRDSLDRVQRNQKHLLSLINDILGFARIETGNLTLKLEATPVAEAVEEIEALVNPDIVRKKITYSATCEANGLTVHADRERLRQVLLNIIGNAVKFTPEGGVVRMIAARDEAGCALLRVSDTGIGIAPEHIERVFEPFVQAEDGRARNYSGVGLGLAIVRDLVTAMHGTVWIESRVGQGTTVTVRLPEGPPAATGS